MVAWVVSHVKIPTLKNPRCGTRPIAYSAPCFRAMNLTATAGRPWKDLGPDTQRDL
jgi:hypothetical protein